MCPLTLSRTLMRASPECVVLVFLIFIILALYSTTSTEKAHTHTHVILIHPRSHIIRQRL